MLLHAWSLGAELLQGRLQASQLPQLAHEAGFEGVEWLDRLLPSYQPQDWQALARKQERAGLKAAALSISLELNAPTSWVSEQLKRAEYLLGNCNLLNIQTVRLSIGQPSLISLGRGLMLLERFYPLRIRNKRPLGRLSRLAYCLGLRAIKARSHWLPPRASHQELVRAADLLRPLARCADDRGIKLGLENHFGLTSHPQDLAALVDHCGHQLGICLDTGNFLPGQEVRQAVRLWNGRIKHVHFKLKQQNPDWDSLKLHGSGIVKELIAQGYQGGCSVEYEGCGAALKHAKKAADLWRSLVAQHQGQA